jgi:ABC-type Fe3+ transport system permease subunit
MIQQLITQFAATNCDKSGNFFGFPTWYTYLHRTADPNNGLCTVQINGLNDVWLIVAAVIEIMLRVAALVAIAFVIYAGFTYVTSQGEPEPTGKAKNTLVNAVVGLAIAILSAAIVSFIARSIHNV